jgi:transposase
MRPRITASKTMIAKLTAKVNQAKDRADINILRKTQAMLAVIKGNRYDDIADLLGVTVETIRLWINDFLSRGMLALRIKKASGRPPKLTKSQKKELKKAVKNGSDAAGYQSGCWNSAMVQDYIYQTFGIFYSAGYVAQLLRNLGLSYQKAAFASAHLDPKKRREWLKKNWPEILKLSKKLDAHLLFGDEASFPQWGSLSYTWAPKGHQPVVQTSGSRRGYKVFGLIDYWTGRFFYKAIVGKFNSASYADFLRHVLSQTRKHIFIIQDGARYHVSKDMQVFFL